jgi:hypothetical protein
MPLLPKKNSLDYNPDATVFASKKLSSIALENMKNPVLDADQSTLSTLQAQKQIGETFDRLEEMAGNYHSLVLRLGGLLGVKQSKLRRDITGAGIKKSKKSKLFGGAEPDIVMPIAYNPAPSRRSSRSSVRSSRNSIDELISEDGSRFSDFYHDDDRNSTATPASSVGRPIYPHDFRGEYPVDDDDAFFIPNRRSFFGDDGDGDPFITKGIDRLSEDVGANFNSLIFPIIQLTRRMNILINSRVKPAVPALSQSQVARLTDIYKMVRTSYNDVIFPDSRRARTGKDPFTKTEMPISRPDPRVNPFYSLGLRRVVDIEEGIIEQNQFGDEVLSTRNTERQNLLLNLTVVINSWKQNTPTGQQTEFNEDVNRSFQNTAVRLGRKAELVEAQGEQPYAGFDYGRDVADLESVGAGRRPRGRPKKKSGSMTLIGNGRNFYEEQINESRDIPSIFTGAFRSCPTKYLL